jgi:hypothetical protein
MAYGSDALIAKRMEKMEAQMSAMLVLMEEVFLSTDSGKELVKLFIKDESPQEVVVPVRPICQFDGCTTHKMKKGGGGFRGLCRAHKKERDRAVATYKRWQQWIEEREAALANSRTEFTKARANVLPYYAHLTQREKIEHGWN